MEKRFLYALLIIAILMTLIIIYPFLTIFILAGAFAVVLKPVYLWLNKHITRNNSGVASFITIIFLLILICGPLLFIGTVIFNQTQSAYYSIIGNGNTSTFIQAIDKYINSVLPNGFTFNTYEKITQLFSFLSNNIAGFFTYTINTILMFIFTILTTFFLLKNGKEWEENLIKLSPLSDKNGEKILSNLKSAINRVLKGTFFIAVIQGVISWIGLTIFGVPNPAFWGVVAGFAAFIPNIGIFIVSVPSILFLYFTGMHMNALGLLIYSIILIGGVNNFLAPYFISKNSDIPPLFIMFSILGGLSVIGPIGLLIGPLVLSFLYSLVSIYRKEVKIN